MTMDDSLHHQQASALVSAQNESCYDRAKAIKAFDDSKAGVKGLVDAGIKRIPEFFAAGPEEVLESGPTHLQIPVIDLAGARGDAFRRKTIVDDVRRASETWGFFQVLNHGLGKEVLPEMIEGVRRFNEQATEVKMRYYTRDVKKVRFNSNFDLYQSKAANWRDTLVCIMAPDPPSAEELPETCREIIMEYSKKVRELGYTLCELLAEALGLHPNHLIEMDCAAGHAIFCHYYPACPEPGRTFGTSRHSDPDFFTILLQDQIGGLQIFHQNQWVNISPLAEALVVNLGDLMQLISNDKFRSADHRVLANRVGPRISVACFFSTHYQPSNRFCSPIEELLSDDKPPLYREILVSDYVSFFKSKGLGSGLALDYFRL
ncbi:1-aminocyclopropane-1-carboxylate oxidase homolog 1-like [Malania oleifera]|uniref:1-aminocyclopropane-1-carboxylate oxidase homolog 1-like n=1 Tax=Malania oleifera TaxID=397392 RepID=UPI0025ADD42B|nr:1-aminocyclopropane-1-carboxylate oxidase homolog 1-like [Malania oleifera]